MKLTILSHAGLPVECIGARVPLQPLTVARSYVSRAA